MNKFVTKVLTIVSCKIWFCSVSFTQVTKWVTKQNNRGINSEHGIPTSHLMFSLLWILVMFREKQKLLGILIWCLLNFFELQFFLQKKILSQTTWSWGYSEAQLNMEVYFFSLSLIWETQRDPLSIATPQILAITSARLDWRQRVQNSIWVSHVGGHEP